MKESEPVQSGASIDQMSDAALIEECQKLERYVNDVRERLVEHGGPKNIEDDAAAGVMLEAQEPN